MSTETTTKSDPLEKFRKLDTISPFELKDELGRIANLAKDTQTFLNAGRGNPNWIATTPREAYWLFGTFGIEESKRVWDDKDLGGMPDKNGIGARFDAFIAKHAKDPGAEMLKRGIEYGVKELGFEKDAWVYELTDAIIGDMYPVPPRMGVHMEKVVCKYLVHEMCGDSPPAGKYDVFAVEGGTAAMCYIFDTLMVNGLLKRGDKIALAMPTFTPYIEIAHLDRYSFEIVEVNASSLYESGAHSWQYPDSEIDKIADPAIKAFFVVNPSNPPSYAMARSSLERITKIVREKRKDLIIITDDVYGTFVEGFESLMKWAPRNTITVYSFSKYFGCTGWRLGAIAVHENNVFDEMIAALPESEKQRLRKRYGPLTLTPDKIKFIDRLVADSRQIALNHTAGLSMPQQVMMTFFALFDLTDTGAAYKHLTRKICQSRLEQLWKGMNLPLVPDPLRAGYYSTLDLMKWAELTYGDGFMKYLAANYHPLQIVFALATYHAIVLLNGSGFGAPDWSVRVSLANLPDKAYKEIGADLVQVAQTALERWKQQEAKAKA
ncbi:MAG TPA: bifunctional aspartate transaminase/aspartate 4-decarboxylase [Candidatus Binatus sp.]|nr:bifunctional aspartate transaminase/aspartate 4-decarboxylase [Candidatus Binatus sp.]